MALRPSEREEKGVQVLVKEQVEVSKLAEQGFIALYKQLSLPLVVDV